MTDCKQNKMTGLIFSRDRAMQLHAVIESFFLHCRNSSQIQLRVLYKASNPLHRLQYDKLKQTFPGVTFIQETNFKEQLLAAIGGSEFVLFLVDDNLFVADFDLGDITESLRSNLDAAGFSLRLGSNTTCCYAKNAAQSLPQFQRLDERILKYDWTNAEHDFGYPLEVSSSVYRTADILELLEQVRFTNPNTLECAMAANAPLYRLARKSLLCFARSVTFCAPVNMVQKVWDNRAGDNRNYSPESLAQMFDDGQRIDVQEYAGFIPNACHEEVRLRFKDCPQTPSAPDDCRRQNPSPKFSIIMANHNNAIYIAGAIESVRRQTFQEWELIIVEDCSTDNSLAVIEQFLGDPRIKLARHQTNRGYTAALKTGIAHVRAEVFGVLDSDDALAPHALETMYESHIEFPYCGLIYSQFAFCAEDMTPRKPGFCREIPPGDTTLDANAVSHFKTFKLRDYSNTAGYDENILYAEDIDIVYKMEEVARLKFVDQCLYFYRETPDSIARSREKINVAIMSRVKARLNALNRRCRTEAGRSNQSFDDLFRSAVARARCEHKDVEQYFILLTKLHQNQMLANVNWPREAQSWTTDDAVLWLAANVDVQFDKLFDLIAKSKAAGSPPPMITVEMAAYNAEKFIARAIDSVLAQTYPNFELLIVDDGSTDGTAEIIASHSDPRIRYIRTPHKNCAAARNRAITEAAGEYLLCVDSDDFIAPTYIEKMVAAAQRRPDVDYFYPSRLELVDALGNVADAHWDYSDFSDNSPLPAFIFDAGFGPIPNPGSLKRKSLFDKVGTYDDVDSVEDFVFLCRNALRIKFMRVDDHADYFYRRLPTGSSHNYRPRNQIMADILNEMVSIYPPQVLYPQIAAVTDQALKDRYYNEYLMNTFYKHAEGPMVQYGEYFRKYAEHYKQSLSHIYAIGG